VTINDNLFDKTNLRPTSSCDKQYVMEYTYIKSQVAVPFRSKLMSIDIFMYI